MQHNNALRQPRRTCLADLGMGVTGMALGRLLAGFHATQQCPAPTASHLPCGSGHGSYRDGARQTAGRRWDLTQHRR